MLFCLVQVDGHLSVQHYVTQLGRTCFPTISLKNLAVTLKAGYKLCLTVIHYTCLLRRLLSHILIRVFRGPGTVMPQVAGSGFGPPARSSTFGSLVRNRIDLINEYSLIFTQAETLSGPGGYVKLLSCAVRYCWP